MAEEEQQLLFDFDNLEPQKNIPEKTDEIKNQMLHQAVIAWTVIQNPTAIAVQVPIKFSKFKADVAAFWSEKKGNKYLMPRKTLICIARHKVNKLFTECCQHEKLIMELNNLRKKKVSLEAEIRETEPELRDQNNLFNEFDTWNYKGTKNPEYQECCAQIKKIEYTIYHGTVFERIRSAHIANYMYLAVPYNTLHEYDIAEGWGLLYVYPDSSVKVIKEAEFFESSPDMHYHLIQQIAASATDSVLFSWGIRISPDNQLYFTPRPHRRRKKSQ